MKDKILIVDDDKLLLGSLKRLLHSEYVTATAESGEEGLDIIRRDKSFSVIISDYQMYGMKGSTFLALARDVSPNTVRIMLTGKADLQTAIDSINKGNIFRFVNKPVQKEQFIPIIRDAVEQHKLLLSEKMLLEGTVKGAVKILTDILAMTNPEAFRLSSEIRDMMKRIGRRFNCRNIWEFEMSGMLSQIGCVAVPDEIVRKKNSGEELTKAEQIIYFSHPRIAAKWLDNLPKFENICKAFALVQFDAGNEKKAATEKAGNAHFLSQALRCISDFVMFKNEVMSEKAALERLFNDASAYNTEILKALESELKESQRMFHVEELEVKDIKSGMKMAEDLYDDENNRLVSKGEEITDVLKMKISNAERYKGIGIKAKVVKHSGID